MKISNKLKVISIIFVIILMYAWLIPQLIVTSSTIDFINEDASTVKTCDAIVVPGARVINGKPSWMLKERLDAAIILFKKGKAPKILVSGGVADSKSNEPVIMKEYLINNGIPSSDILMDEGGSNSFRTFYRAKYNYNFKNIIITTTRYHLFRCIFISHKLGINAEGFPASNHHAYNMIYNVCRESLANIKALLNIYLFKPDTNLKSSFIY